MSKKNRNVSPPQRPQGGLLGEPVSDLNTAVLYANYAAVSSTPEEFVFRFCQRSLEGDERPKEVARIFVSLNHAKRLLIAMGRTLQVYEEMFGEIPIEATLTPEGKKKLANQQEVKAIDASNS